MVIVITGMQSINKKFLARLLLAKFNTFKHNEYTCDFSSSDFKVYNANNEFVYQPSSDNNEGINKLSEKSFEEYNDVVTYFNNLNTKIFELGVKHNHFINVFCSLEVDYGLYNKPEYEYTNTKLLHPHNFSDVILNIKKSPLSVKVISGTFGKCFLQKLKEAMPYEKIIILNFQRNPSVSFLFNKKPDTKWLTEINPDLTEELDRERFYESLLNSIEIAKLEDVTTIKFEDMIREGRLVINKDISIECREDYKAFNNWITIGESQMDILMSEEEFEPFNEYISNYNVDKFYEKNDDDILIYNKSYEEILETIKQYLPTNLFEATGYKPLTYSEILEK